MKTRFVFSSFCMLVAMTMATGAFAQAIFTVSGGIEARGRENGHAELAGGVTLFLNSGKINQEDKGTVVIDYGVDITNGVNPTADEDGITVNICDANKAVPADDPDTDKNEAVAVDGSTIVISLDAAKCVSDGSTVNVDGVLLSLVGSGASSIMASVTATGAVRLPGGATNRVTVIENVVDPLEDENVEVVQKVTLIRHEGEPEEGDPSKFHLVITEPHVDSFNGAQLELKFSGIPDDVNIEDLDAWVTTKTDFDNSDTKTTDILTNQIPVGAPTMRVDDADEDGEVTVYLEPAMLPAINLDDDNDTKDPGEIAAGMGGSLTGGIDVVVIRGSIEGADAEELLPIDLTIDVAVDLGPIGDDDDAEIPRFASDRTTPLTVIESTSAQTMFLVPYAVVDGLGGGYDTGFSIANTTSGTTAQAGTVTFSFPGDATLEAFESDMVGPGQNLTMLLSEILGLGASYTGQVKIIANWTDAEGVAFVSNFLTFTSASPLVNLEKNK